ncbi:hypothetical protein [Streptomyces sp. NPDC000880]
MRARLTGLPRLTAIPAPAAITAITAVRAAKKADDLSPVTGACRSVVRCLHGARDTSGENQ